jgi:hypothetical protein
MAVLPSGAAFHQPLTSIFYALLIYSFRTIFYYRQVLFVRHGPSLLCMYDIREKVDHKSLVEASTRG